MVRDCAAPAGGGFVFLIGWLVGFVLLWSSRVWTTRDKLIGTLVPPGGLAGVALSLLLAGTGSGSVESAESSGGVSIWGITFIVTLVALPILTTIYLAWQANRRSG